MIKYRLLLFVDLSASNAIFCTCKFYLHVSTLRGHHARWWSLFNSSSNIFTYGQPTMSNIQICRTTLRNLLQKKNVTFCFFSTAPSWILSQLFFNFEMTVCSFFLNKCLWKRVHRFFRAWLGPFRKYFFFSDESLSKKSSNHFFFKSIYSCMSTKHQTNNHIWKKKYAKNPNHWSMIFNNTLFLLSPKALKYKFEEKYTNFITVWTPLVMIYAICVVRWWNIN